MKTKKAAAAAGAEDERRRTDQATTNTKGGGVDHEAAAAAVVVVLRMELHCDGCALKVRKAIEGAEGVERVRTGSVTVAGKADPWDLRDRIKARMPAAVDITFVSPPNPPRPPPKPKDPKQQQQWRWSINKNKGGNKQQMPPPESTVVLNIQLHCKGCTDKANSIKGVKQVTVDTAKEQVTVKGTMDAKALPDVLSAKLKRRVTLTAVVVPPTTNKKKKAAAADDNHDGNREHGEATSTAGGAKKKTKNWKQQQQQQQRGEAVAVAHSDEMVSLMSEEQQFPTVFPASYGRGGSVGSSSYRFESLQGPQPFSDENPPSCEAETTSGVVQVQLSEVHY